MSKHRRIILAGNPNCGKTTIFNILTGLNQKASNLAGTTVEITSGNYSYESIKYEVVDIPGAYSIYGDTLDQKLAIEELISTKAETDLMVYVADANQIYRNLTFFAQLCTLKRPIILVVNLHDTIQEGSANIEQLKSNLGITAVPYSAVKPKPYEDLKKVIGDAIHEGRKCAYFEEIYPQEAQNYEGKERANKIIAVYQKVAQLLSKSPKQKAAGNKLTSKLDRWLMHPILGFAFFGLVMFLLFQILFKVAEYPMNWIDNSMLWITNLALDILPEGSLLSSLVTDGIIAGFGGVVIFIPQIALLFLLLGILEDTGYVSRISYLLDSILQKFGLSGKSVIPMVGGFACAIPAIMSARTIGNSKERLITMLVTPLMACSARLPVYTVLIGVMAINHQGYWADQRGLVFFGLYMLGIIAALVFAAAFKFVLKSNSNSHMILELPQYRKPIFRNIWNNTWLKTWQFIKGAGLIIFMVSIVLWVLASFGPSMERNQIEQQYAQTEMNDSLQQEKSSKLLEASYAGILGKTIEPVIAPLGYDWKIGIAIITSFAAREVFVGTMSTIYAVESEEEDLIINRLRSAKRADGTAVFSAATIISLLLFYAFALQCVSTIAIMKKETHGWKWPLIQLAYMTALAYLSALVAFQLLS